MAATVKTLSFFLLFNVFEDAHSHLFASFLRRFCLTKFLATFFVASTGLKQLIFLALLLAFSFFLLELPSFLLALFAIPANASRHASLVGSLLRAKLATANTSATGAASQSDQGKILVGDARRRTIFGFKPRNRPIQTLGAINEIKIGVESNILGRNGRRNQTYRERDQRQSQQCLLAG